MKGKSIVITVFSLTITVWILLEIIAMIKKQTEVNSQFERALEIPLFDMDGCKIEYLAWSKNTCLIITYFSSTCDHCQYQIKDFEQNHKDFKDSNILLISSESISKIIEYSKKYNLYYSNVKWAKLNEFDVYKYFGNAPVPYTLIYDGKGNLISQYRGEVRFSQIKKICDEDKKLE